MAKNIRTTSVLVVLLLGILGGALVSAATPKLTIIGPFTGWGDSLERAIGRFSETHGVDVEILVSASWGDHEEKVITMAAAGIAPDVIYGEDYIIPTMISRDIMLPLDRFVSKDQIDLDRYPPSVMQVIRQQANARPASSQNVGTIYSLPTALSLYATYYRPNHFAEAGLSPLPVDWNSNEFMWEDFVDTARKLTRDTTGDGEPERFGIQPFGWGSGMNFISLWEQQWFNESLTGFNGMDPGVIDAMTKLTRLRTEAGVVGGSLLEESASMAFYMASSINTLVSRRESGDLFEWRLGVLPKGASRNAEAGFHQIGVSAQSQHPELAWELVKFLAYGDGVIEFNEAENRVPVLPESGQAFVERLSALFPNSNIEALIGSIDYVWNFHFWYLPRADDIWNVLIPAGQRILAGEAPVAPTLAEISPVLDSLVKER